MASLSNIGSHGFFNPLTKDNENDVQRFKVVREQSLAYDPEKPAPYVLWLSPDDVINVSIRPMPRKSQPNQNDYHKILPQLTEALTANLNLATAGLDSAKAEILGKAIDVLNRTQHNKKALDAARALLIQA